MFGRKKTTQAPKPVARPTLQQRIESMSPEDHALLTALAHEIVGCFDCGNGDLLLDDAEHVYVATIPVPVLEIEYPDRLVSLHMEVYHYSDEELGG